MRHPDAKDTSQGILEWWLKAGHGQVGAGEIEEILDLMVEKGWIVQTKTGSSPKIYGVNHERMDEIQAFLGSLPEN